MKRFLAEVKSEGDDLYIQFSEEFLNSVGWKEGDTIKWSMKDDNSFFLEKVKNMDNETEYVLVDTISTFRMRYCVEVPKGKSEWALDSVTMQEAKEFSQVHLGETIVSHRVVSKEEAIKVFKEDNDYLKSWSESTIIENSFTQCSFTTTDDENK